MAAGKWQRVTPEIARPAKKKLAAACASGRVAGAQWGATVTVEAIAFASSDDVLHVCTVYGPN